MSKKKDFILLFSLIVLQFSVMPALNLGVHASPEKTSVKGAIDIGISKYGEMICFNSTSGIGVGLQSPGWNNLASPTWDQRDNSSRDAFANENLTSNVWINGWFCEIRYTNNELGSNESDRRVLSMAMFGDMTTIEGNWLVGHPGNFALSPHAGRKTTGYAETEDLKVLFNGTDLWIAECVNTIYDWKDMDGDTVVDHPNETWPLLQVKITYVYNKNSQSVYIKDELELLAAEDILDSPLDVQFGNRESWIMSKDPNHRCYAHLYRQEKMTSFEPASVDAPAIMREFILSGYNLNSADVPVIDDDGTIWMDPIVPGSVRLYVNQTFKQEYIDYNISYQNGTLYNITITPADYVEIIYKLVNEGTADMEPSDYDANGQIIGDIDWLGVTNRIDIIQMITNDILPNADYVGWKGFWPELSDYTVDGWADWWEPLIDEDREDLFFEPDVPFCIGEWDFMLGQDYPSTFTGIEGRGLSKNTDGSDINDGSSNVLDTTALIELNRIFNNTSPSTPVAELKPALPYTTDDIFCNLTTTSTDPEGDPVVYYYEWYRDQGWGFVLQPAYSTLTDEQSNTLPSTATGDDETWRCVVTPSDGIMNGSSCEDQVPVGTMEVFTEGGVVVFEVDSGNLEGLKGIDMNDMPQEGMPKLNYTYDFFSFNITGLTPGQTVNITITFPEPIPTDAQFWKYGPTLTNPAPHWYQVTFLDNDGDSVIVLIFQDGGFGDNDLTLNGIIVEPSGLGLLYPPIGGQILQVNPSVIPFAIILLLAIVFINIRTRVQLN